MTYTDPPGLSISENPIIVSPSWNVLPWERSACLIDLLSMNMPLMLPRSLSINGIGVFYGRVPARHCRVVDDDIRVFAHA